MKMSKDKSKYRKQRVYTYLSTYDIKRLENIAKAYGFNSIYKVLQYLSYCFLRVADPANDVVDEPIPQEISDMFELNSDWENSQYSVGSHKDMTIRKRPDQRKIKSPDDLNV